MVVLVVFSLIMSRICSQQGEEGTGHDVAEAAAADPSHDLKVCCNPNSAV